MRERRLESRAVGERGLVAHRPPELDERLLESAAADGRHGHAHRTASLAEQRRYRWRVRNLGQQRGLVGDQLKSAACALDEAQAPVAGAQIPHVGEHRLRDRVARDPVERGRSRRPASRPLRRSTVIPR